MKRILKGIYATLLVWAFATIAYTEENRMPLTPQKAVDSIIQQVDPSVYMGALVVDLNTGHTLYARNEDIAFTPASNMKLFSDAAALLALGPNYRFQTELSTNAKQLHDGVLKGSIYLHMPGDPSFTSQNLKHLLSALKTWQIKAIEGNIIIISDRRHISPYADGWTKRDVVYSYGAPLSPVVLDENRMVVTVNPGAKINQKAVIEMRPKNSGIHLINQVTTKSSPEGCGLSYQMDNMNQLVVKGCIGLGEWSAEQGLAVQNPSEYTKAQIHAMLKSMHIDLNGKIKYGKKPQKALLLAKHRSKTITELLADTLKTSDNLYADSLFLHTASKLNGGPVNWGKAQTTVRKFLEQETGIELKNANLTDGSGLSRQDKLTAKQTVELLQFLHARFPLAYEYIAALPVAGRDGTLKKRLKKPSQQGFVRAKTGTMRGIVSLSGYLYTANGHTLAFAIYVNKQPNNKTSKPWNYAKLVDAVCDYFLKHNPTTQSGQSLKNAHARVAFQMHQSEAERHSKYAQKWRHIELALKRALKGKPVAVIYRKDHLILDDQSNDPKMVLRALQQVQRKYPFSTALQSEVAPPKNTMSASLLWIKASQEPSSSRTWTLKDSAG